MGRASKIMAPTSCFTGQVHRLPDSPEAYGAMISRPMAAPAQSRSVDLAPCLSAEVAMRQPLLAGCRSLAGSQGHGRHYICESPACAC
jgi:hypothetical protein